MALEYPALGVEPNQLCGCEVSLLLTDNPTIHRLNSSFRGVDRPTDVLSFPQYQAGEAPQPHSSLGDIVISLPKMAEQAAAFDHSQKRELCFLFVHGLLHLLGYDHELSDAEERRQFARQDEVLAALGIYR
ncbi:MAG: rRNA maturation RNase YbeY [Peptococcaceae bacterium]|nr:rRNA maturation RNase YbeY [Peptococcaceae bacterium]